MPAVLPDSNTSFVRTKMIMPSAIKAAIKLGHLANVLNDERLIMRKASNGEVDAAARIKARFVAPC